MEPFALERLDASAWIGLGSALIATVSAVVAIIASRRAGTQVRQDPAVMISPPPPAGQPDWAEAYFDGVLRWADGACRELALAIHLAETPSEPNREYRFREIRAALTHLIDTGRWYFPNSQEPGIDRDFPPAYRGKRHPALDLLVAAQGLVGKTDPIGISALVRAKREFVSHIQVLVNPNRRDAGIAGVLHRFSAVSEEPGQLG
jgi:hypothetical protein